jgi:N utilization substance protein B
LARERLAKIQSFKEVIDEWIAKTATAYELERIPRVERNLLRLGIFELLFSQDIPPKVAISEAMRLARKFSSASSADFMNAILDTIYKQQHVYRRETP